ncbi:MAG TPA: hypothetical protein VN476_09605, partial [Pyrinomonadaceae bacterium]|nr:hypothetical protein [Pyrinomonadaceae bacterium]
EPERCDEESEEDFAKSSREHEERGAPHDTESRATARLLDLPLTRNVAREREPDVSEVGAAAATEAMFVALSPTLRTDDWAVRHQRLPTETKMDEVGTVSTS